MSGPKTSRYTLTAAQRRLLAAQLSLQREQAALRQTLAALAEQAEYIRTHAHRLEEFGLPDLTAVSIAAHELLATPAPATEADVLALHQRTQEQSRSAARLVAAVSRQRKAMEKQVNRSIARDIGQGFAATLDDALAAREPSAKDYEARLLAIAESAVVPETAEKARQAASQLTSVTTPAFLKSFAAVTVLPLEKQLRRENEQYAEEQAAYAGLVSRYAALCEQLGLPAGPRPWTPSALATLEQEAADMEARLLEQEEQRYIRLALDDTMVEMGYSLLGEREVHKRSGARFHHTLYTTGDGTAIDVTYDANGQIAMELGGLDDTDRLPDARETTVLCAEMEEFCTSFEGIEDRLAAKGVVLKTRIAMLPPDEAHAQIINVQDYALTGEPVLLDASQSAADRAGSATRYMKKE